jgi:hypothetical protein
MNLLWVFSIIMSFPISCDLFYIYAENVNNKWTNGESSQGWFNYVHNYCIEYPGSGHLGTMNLFNWKLVHFGCQGFASWYWLLVLLTSPFNSQWKIAYGWLCPAHWHVCWEMNLLALFNLMPYWTWCRILLVMFLLGTINVKFDDMSFFCIIWELQIMFLSRKTIENGAPCVGGRMEFWGPPVWWWYARKMEEVVTLSI